MSELIQSCACFGLFLTLGAYLLGLAINNRFKSPLTNPILLSLVIIIPILLLCKVDYNTYYEGAKYISILLGIFSGVLASGLSIAGMSALFHLSHTDYVTLLPKSVTTAIGMSLSTELGGVAAITVTAIVVTGIFGNCLAVFLCRLFRITDPVAKGLAIGTASHALGTSKALEIGEVEGAMSGLSIAVAGLMTVVVAPLFAALL